MKALNRHFSLNTPGFNSKTPARHLIACNNNQLTVYSRYEQQLQIQHHNTTPQPLPVDSANTVLHSIHAQPNRPPQGLYAANRAVLIPASLYDAAQMTSYLADAFYVMPNETVVAAPINEQLIQLFPIPTALQTLVSNTLGEGPWAHPAGIMIPVYQSKAEQHANHCLFFYATDNMAAFTLFQNGQLQSQHVQDFQQDTDLLYTLLHLNEQLSNPQEPVTVYWHGEWSGLTPLIQQLETKHWPLHALVHPDAALLSELPNTAFYPLHQLYSSCVS